MCVCVCVQETEAQLKRMQVRLREEEMKLMRGEEDAMGIYDDAGQSDEEQGGGIKAHTRAQSHSQGGQQVQQARGEGRGVSPKHSAHPRSGNTRPHVKGSISAQAASGSDLVRVCVCVGERERVCVCVCVCV